MSERAPLIYHIDPALNIDRLLGALRACADFQTSMSAIQPLVYLDTPDEAIVRDGGALQAKDYVRYWGLLRESVAVGRSVASCRVDSLPGRMADIPAGTLHDQLAPLVGDQPLVTIAEIQLERQLLVPKSEDRVMLTIDRAMHKGREIGRRLCMPRQVDPDAVEQCLASAFREIKGLTPVWDRSWLVQLRTR